MPIDESGEARREREGCLICKSLHRRSVERMRRVERAGYPDIQRFLQTVGEDVSLRWVIRHFGRGHDRFSPTSEDTEIPAWLYEDEEEFERYMHQYGYSGRSTTCALTSCRALSATATESITLNVESGEKMCFC